MNQSTIAILGAGSWGTAVAIHLARAGQRVLLWAHRPEHVHDMAQTRQNKRYLPDVMFPEGLLPTADLDACMTKATQVIVAVPSHAFSSLLSKLAHRPAGLAWLTKGIDPESHRLLSELVADKWGEAFPVAAISGPSFAHEVARGLPTALTLAGNNPNYLDTLQRTLHNEKLRVYLTPDLVGVQLCGAVKNVLAIACGISDGLAYGANAKAALITRGLAEMTRLGTQAGAHQETFMGLAGLGDLVLTCTDNQSRNRRFGLLLGEGMLPAAAEKHVGQVVEGMHNAAQVCALAAKYHLEMPICSTVKAILEDQISPQQAVDNLMNRPPKEEYTTND